MLTRVKRLLVTLGLLTAPEVTALAEASPGPVRLVGTLSCDQPITSPIRGRPCIAYVYRARVSGSGRVGVAGVRMRELHRATAYAPVATLQLSDGEVELRMPDSTPLAADAHAALVEQDLPGFSAVETTIVAGHRVQVLGRLEKRASDQRRQLHVSALVRVPDDDTPSG